MENPYPWYAPRMWHGMAAGDLWPLLARNARRVSPANLGLALTTGLAAPGNSVLRVVSEAFNRKRVGAAKVDRPLFVLGHWRSGTTLLHELISLDEQFAYPTTYQCLAPHHFLFSESWLAPVMQLLTPKQRPMDAMPLHVSLPQEDEFALAILGAASPYAAWGFPGRFANWPELLDTEGLNPQDRRRWLEAMEWFARRVSAVTAKRIVFKSPPHTARIKALRQAFPDAQFLHILRDPYEVFASTVRTWRATTQSQWLEKTGFEELEEQVFEAFTRMYVAFQRDQPAIPKGDYCEVRFEQLVAQPLEEMQRVYQELDLGPFDAVRAGLDKYFAERKSFKKHVYQRDPELERRITQRWGDFIESFGYQRLPAQAGGSSEL